jgi:hypothetical protein
VENRLLILACSERKKGTLDPIPAIERYDGPLWKVLRNFLRDQPLSAAKTDIYVLSAEFGLIPGTHLIPWYNRVMTATRADELRTSVLDQFRLLMDQDYCQVCLGLSQLYLRAMRGWEYMSPSEVSVTVTDGSMATKQGQLRAWLRGESWEPAVHPPNRLLPAKAPRSEIVLNGIRLRITSEEILERARTALAAGLPGADSYREWYVRVDGQPVAPKWLVSLISGIPVGSFDAKEARRVLSGLGIDVEHIS